MSDPYIVTTTKTVPPGPSTGREETLVLSRRAVATLDEAQRTAYDAVRALTGGSADPLTAVTVASSIVALPESGGTIGPLPDGTVIEVERLTRDELGERVFAFGRESATLAQIIDTYNQGREASA
jgi:hypothetical protein